MTSLTTMCATSDLMRRPTGDRAHPMVASRDERSWRPASPTTKALCAAASMVITMSMLGGVAVGMTTPTAFPASAGAHSA